METTSRNRSIHEDSQAEEKGFPSRVEERDPSSLKASLRWPKQETLLLLKIRSDMDSLFRDSSHKAALWQNVSRKLADNGYNRTPEKCKEKFDNVYKYHKRTKDGRTGKSSSRSYRFCDQLEAFVQPLSAPSSSSIKSPTPLSSRPPQGVAAAPVVSFLWASKSPSNTHVTPLSIPNPLHLQSSLPPTVTTAPVETTQLTSSLLSSSSTSSATASDEGMRGGSRKKGKKWKRFFKRMAYKVLMKQDEIQRRFFLQLEKYDMERQMREEAKRAEEMARIDKEHQMLTQERATSAAKDASFISLLNKASGEVVSSSKLSQMTAQSEMSQQVVQPAGPLSPVVLEVRGDGRKGKISGGASSRWPKAEVHALITIRTGMDTKYQQNASKGVLWEEVSAGMKQLGYQRNAKRCKEKWENINKYFKKVKESSKKRSDESKTCPYFQQLDALYEEKRKRTDERNHTMMLQSGDEGEEIDEEEGEETDSEVGSGYEIIT